MINSILMRSALFVPGNRPERIDKALNSGADAIIIDLEDAVTPDQKQAARAAARATVLSYAESSIIVRVNSLASGLLQADLGEVIVEGLRSIMLPKVETAADLVEMDGLLVSHEEEAGLAVGSISVIPLIETALGIQNVYEIVSRPGPHKRVFTAAFGAADYTLDLGIEMTLDGMELMYPRSRMAVACRAARINPPLDSPFLLDIKNETVFRADAERARQLGFQGKQCIHPAQVGPCNDVFSPTEAEVERARKIIEAYEEAEARGLGALQLDGMLVDYPVVERARRVLHVAEPGSEKQCP